MSVLVGGVGQLYQGDLDLGRLAVERLAGEQLGSDVLVEELHYGAVAVAQRLADVRPDALVLVGAAARGRPLGAVERRRIRDLDLTPAEVHVAVSDAVVGYVTMDLVVEVAWGLNALPARTVAIEVEPAQIEPSESLSAEAERGLDQAIDLVRVEVGRVPLLDLAEQIRALVVVNRLAPAPALAAMTDLLSALEVLDDEGRWGRTFAERDRLRLRIASGETGEGMDHLDWALWWALIEELDRLQQVEGASAQR